MIVLFFFVVLICLAIAGIIFIAEMIFAFWMVAAAIALLVLVFRLLQGQRGEQLWRKPFSRRLRPKKPPSQAAYSNRR